MYPNVPKNVPKMYPNVPKAKSLNLGFRLSGSSLAATWQQPGSSLADNLNPRFKDFALRTFGYIFGYIFGNIWVHLVTIENIVKALRGKRFRVVWEHFGCEFENNWEHFRVDLGTFGNTFALHLGFLAR